jgi:hypothetical protein
VSQYFVGARSLMLVSDIKDKNVVIRWQCKINKLLKLGCDDLDLPDISLRCNEIAVSVINWLIHPP